MNRREEVFENAEQATAAFAATFMSPTGANVLEFLKRQHFFYRSTFDSNPQVTAHREGQREVVLAIERALTFAEHPPVAEEEELDNA